MKMKFSVVFIVILQVSLFKLSQQKKCYHTVMTLAQTRRSTTAYRDVGYAYSCGFLGWRRCRAVRKIPYDVYYYVTKSITVKRQICCAGYGDYPLCRPICAQGCHNGGTCVMPGTCSCSSGWTGYDCKRPICPQGCYNGGTCTRPDICDCSQGWTGHNCKTPICSQGCHNGGTCMDVDTCKCSSGWKGHDCKTPICSQGCHNGGSCVLPDICKCATGWSGSSCTKASCAQGCHNGGTCVIPGTCKCSSGWTGYDCKRPICPQGCYNGGTCTRPDICNCNPGWTGHNCKTPICSQGCHNGGTCMDVDTCKCSSGWKGHDCKTPICSQGCHNGGSCVLPDICKCATGWSGSSCSTPICSTGCYNGGTCIGPEVCNCKPEWTGISCRTPVCSQRCHNGGTCVGPGICSCKAGWKGSNCTTPDCPQDCYNGGVCTSPFTCTCMTGYTGPDCKIAQCQQVCSNGGICIKPNVCGCKTGWTGYNCTTPHCSQGCYNGECLSSDRCKCFIGWTGSDCTKDINECNDLRTCGYNQKCINTAGSYKCECVTGFKPDTRTLIDSTYYHCTDINECEGDQNFCSQICNNQIGSFNCACKDGYILQADGKQCLDINECFDHNGGCNHMCINTPGSYYCSCNSGYELQADKHNCTDIMECENGLHNCSQVCIELQGEFACTCYNGYELLEDGVSCKEINLCEGEISRCQQLCISTNGSFYCDCLTGYQLSPDNMTCKDINECDQRNGSCSQLCNNTVGSYICSCKEGYTLDFDGVNCTALPCPHLMDPRNGQYKCDGPQITGAICRLKCNRGYKVVGAKKRECLNTSKWSENNSFCEILHCDELKNPENGSVILPCAAELGSMCRIICSPDFYTNSTDLTQKCELVNENTTEWSAPPSCIEKQLCYPNPCKHNGSCIETEEDAFVCDCDDVGYTGKTCEVLLINVPQFSTLAINSEIEFTMSSSPDGEFVLQLIPDDKTSLKVVPSSIIFSQTNTHHNVTMKAIKPGKFTLKYRISDKTLNYLPIPPATILVTNGTVSKSDYFDKYGLKPGLLKPGCCSSETLLNIRCPHNMNFFLKSSCGWIKKESFYLSPGIIFSSANDFDMPIAIAGAKIRKQKSNIYLQNLNKDEFENNCTTCSNESGMQPQCNIRPISLNDIQSFICYESLASTFFHHSSKLTPRWLKLNAMSSNRTHDTHSYMVNLVSSDHLKDISECNKLTPITNGFYSVMLYSGLLKVKVNNELMQSESSSAFCFAINLCEGESSPLYIAIPEDAQTILQSLEFMRDLKSKGWSVTVNSLVISDSRIREIMPSVMLTPIMYWNGKEYFSYNQFPYVLTSVKLNKRFSVDDTVKANWVFTGNVFWIHENIRKAYDPNVNLTWDLYFNGFTRVSVNVPVYGEVSSLQLKNDLEPALFLTKGLNNNVSCHGCSNSSGITFKLLYHIADESTGLFSTLLTIPQKGIDPQYSCPLDSFVFLNSKHDLEAISILSSCLGINLGLLPIYDLQTHIYIFNECKIGSLCSILNDNDANIIVWSTFHDSLLTLKLGHFLELLPVSKSNRTGLVVTFSRNYNHFKANLPNLRISLFDTTFKSEAIISEKQVMFSDSVRIFNQYRVKLIGKINQLSNWENVAIEVQGIFTNKPGNIPELICYHIGTYIEVLYNRSQVETYNAKVVYDRAILRFMETNMTFIEHEINKNHSNYLLKQIEEEYRNMSNAVQAITEKLENASTEVKKLQEDINNLCTITECVDICIPQQICEECQRTITVPIQGTCIYQCTKLENITIITGSEVATKWEYTPQENCIASPSCRQVFTCVSNTVCETNYVSIPIEYIKYKTETRLVSTVDSCDKPCSETVVTAPVTALCCANLTCNSTEQDVECLNQNQQCAQVREMVYLNLDEADKNAAEILRSLEEAKRNESVIKLRLLRSRVNYDFAEKKFNESKRAYNDAASMLEIATISFKEVKKRAQLAKLEKIKNSSVCGFAPPSYFEIRSVRFDTTIITESPTQLVVDVVIFISQNVTVTETLYIDFNNVNSSLKQGAITIIEKLVLSQNTVFKRHFRRQTNDFLPNNEFYFQKRCADISNILDYIKELNRSIFTIADSAISSISGLKNNVLELSNLIKYSTNISNEELTIDSQQISNIINRNLTHFNTTDIKISGEIDELVKVMQEYLLNSQELENELGNSLYQSWQVKMEDLHNQTKSAAGFQCIGFSGCLQNVVDTLNDLISDIPLNINSIQSEFSNAAQSLMNLALLQNYDIVSAVSNTKNIYEIASNPSVTDYWCASIPKIIVHPVQYINATENATIELSCKAEVDQYTSYQWKKDGIQLFNQRNSTLVLTNLTLSDSGNYSCVITNQVGSANSFNSTVEVIQFPSFLLEPEDVNEYLGNVNGAIFQCNASGFPYPGYKWYFQPKGEKGFNKVPSSDQNVLVIAPPLPKDEGSYYCEAFIGNISIQSRVATLTVLDATVIQVAQTVYLNFSYLNRIGETEVQSSGSGSELTLEENIRHYINNDFSGSGEAEIGSGMNRVKNITITPYTKVALERSFLNALNTLMSFGSTTVQNITLSFVTPFDLAISFTLYSQNINYSMASFSRTNQLVPQAMIEWENTWQNLQELFSVSGFIITDNEYEYESLPSSLNVDILQFICPAGKEVSSANNLICANCLPGSYQALDIRRVVDENDGRIIQYITPKCVRCPVGEYQNEQGQVLCKQCSPGYATLTNGAKQCLAQCSPGEYSQSGLEPCVMCPNETYSFANGSTTCYSCSDSNYQPLCPMHKIRYCPQGCYNNGTCVSPYTCICTAGWSGLDCNTGSAVKFSQLTYSIAEDSGPLQTVLILDNSLSINVTVQIIDSNNTALRGADYHSGPYNVTFMAGVTSVSLDISILDDDVIEDNENFTLTINIDSLPDGIITSNPSKVTVIIRNDDIAAECTIPKLDIVFVLDVSNSIKNEENFGVMKDFVKNTVDLMTINLKNSLAAVVLFGGKAWIQFSLTEHTNKNSFQNAMDSLKYKALKQAGTNTLDALNLLRIAGQDGRLGLRNDTIKIIVLITDGRPNLGHLNIPADQAAADTREAATKLHESGIYDQIYSVGIEGARPIGEFLEVVANPPSLVYHITGFNATLFQKLTQNFLSSFCDDGTKAPQ